MCTSSVLIKLNSIFCCSSFSTRNASVLTRTRQCLLASYNLLQLFFMIIMNQVRSQFIGQFSGSLNVHFVASLWTASAFLTGIQCTVFYSAPKRSKMISKLCSDDVCQCAESKSSLLKPGGGVQLSSQISDLSQKSFNFLGPCYNLKNTFQSQSGQYIRKSDRMQHACFVPTVDYGTNRALKKYRNLPSYSSNPMQTNPSMRRCSCVISAYIVEVSNISMKSNFEVYEARLKDVLRTRE